MSNKVRLAKERMDNFSDRGSKCPICRRDLRKGFPQSKIPS